METKAYESTYKNRSTTSHPGRSSVSANDPTRVYHGTSGTTVPQAEQSVKNEYTPEQGAHIINTLSDIKPIHFPFSRIALNVFPNLTVIGLIANHMVVEGALEYLFAHFSVTKPF